MFIFVLFFATYGFFNFTNQWWFGNLASDVNMNVCSNLAHCVLSSFYFGIRGEVGPGHEEYASQLSYSVSPIDDGDGDWHTFERFTFDTLYYFVLNVILLNIIFGIIYDKYADLRDEEHEKE